MRPSLARRHVPALSGRIVHRRSGHVHIHADLCSLLCSRTGAVPQRISRYALGRASCAVLARTNWFPPCGRRVSGVPDFCEGVQLLFRYYGRINTGWHRPPRAARRGAGSLWWRGTGRHRMDAPERPVAEWHSEGQGFDSLLVHLRERPLSAQRRGGLFPILPLLSRRRVVYLLEERVSPPGCADLGGLPVQRRQVRHWRHSGAGLRPTVGVVP